jgi:hypothetical protein
MNRKDELRTRIKNVEHELQLMKEELEKPEVGELWVPKIGENYWVLDADGLPHQYRCEMTTFFSRVWQLGNCFKTEAAANRRALQIESMKPTCPVPKVGDSIWGVDVNFPKEMVWREQDHFTQAYQLGRIFTSKEAANEWIAKYGDAWTTLGEDK